MTREELKGRQTLGKYNVGSGRPGSARTITVKENVVAVLDENDQATALCGSPLHSHVHANATLYAEAHNVANRTGMWPEDMVARIKELEVFVEAVDAAESEGLRHHIIEGNESAIEIYDRRIGYARAILNKKPQ